MRRKMISLALGALIACAPTGVLAEETNGWEALLSQALVSVEELTASAGTLRVQASASVNVVPDMAYIRLGMSVVRPELADAQSEANTIVNGIVEALIALGVEEKSIVTSSYSISPQRDYSAGDGTTVTGYYVSNDISVTVEDFALLDAVIDTAVQAGANEVYGLSFDVKDRSAYYRQALVNAVAAGQEKAALLAESAGVTLGDITSISEESTVSSNYSTSNVADSVTMAAAAGTSIQGGELSITAKVELIYACKAIGSEMEPIG